MADDFIVRLELDARDAAGSAKQLANALGLINEELGYTDKKLNAAERALGNKAAADKKAGDAAKAHQQNINTTRYALQDVSQTLGVTGAALTALAVATYGAGIAWERDFANVVRTTDPFQNAEQIDRMRDSFINLQQTLPVTAKDLAEIGTLGGQLGIGAKDLAAFTETVAKFSATTDLTAEAAATAFGRLGNILNVSASDYDKLGSSIALVGVNAVATESEIVAIAQQIGPIARLSKFSADEVIGLAAAMASVRIPPELSRSIITRVFGDIQRSVETGSQSLNDFGAVSGKSGAEFQRAWNQDASGTFVQLLKGINQYGEGSYAALDKIGITSRRDAPTLLKLAQSYEMVGESLNISARGYKENEELNRQYGIIAGTTASRLQLLANNFNALLVTLSDGGSVFGGAIDFATGLLKALTDLADTPVGGIMQFVTLLTGAIGILALVTAGVARVAAGFLAVRTALAGLPAAMAAFGLGAKSIDAAGTSASGAAGKFGALKGALGPVLAIMATIATIQFAAGFREMVNDIDGYANALETAGNATRTFAQNSGTKDFFGNEVLGYSKNLQQFSKDLETIGTSNGWQDFLTLTFNAAPYSAATTAVDNFRDAFKKLQAEGREAEGIQYFQEIVKGANLSEEALAAVLSRAPEVRNALIDALTGLGLEATDENLLALANNDLPAIKNAASEAGLSLDDTALSIAGVGDSAQLSEEQIKGLRDAILKFNETSVSAEETQIALEKSINSLREATGQAGVTIDGTNAASLSFRENLLGVDEAARNAAIGLIQNGASGDEATASYKRGREELIQSIAAKTGDRAAAEAWADRVVGTAGDAESAIRDYAGSYNQIPTNVSTAIRITGASEVENAIFRVRAALNTVAGTTSIGLAGNIGGAVGAIRKASGGYISGPGTGTSDSIPAYLSNGEYVIKAASVQKFGPQFFNALNQGRAPKFASGGPVGNAASGSGLGSMVELGPKSLGRLGGGGGVTVILDDMAIARASNRGNAQIRNNGG